MGRSRGGLETKIHALLDADGLPIGPRLSEGQAHDGKSARDMPGGIGAGRILVADRADETDRLRAALAERGAWADARPRPGRKRHPAFSPFRYRYRDRVERFLNGLGHFRAVATRCDKDPDNHLASGKRAAVRIWIRAEGSVS